MNWSQFTAAIVAAVVPVLVAFVNEWTQKHGSAPAAAAAPYDQDGGAATP